MFEEIAKQKKPIPERLVLYGFTAKDSLYQYVTEICNNEFKLTVQIKPSGEIDTRLVEKETGDEYVLYKTSSFGAYIGEIRAAVEQVVSDIVHKCFETSVFKTAQAQMVIKFIRNFYGDELEFLWEKAPDNAIWRRKDNKKWYGAILTVKGKKIGLETESPVEIIDLRMDPAEAEAILSRENYYPGWHMNKKSWFTLVLNASVSDEEIKQRIKESYKLAKKQARRFT